MCGARAVGVGGRPALHAHEPLARRQGRAGRRGGGGPRWRRPAKGGRLSQQRNSPGGAGPGGAGDVRTRPVKTLSFWARVTGGPAPPRRGPRTPTFHNATQNTRPPCDPKSRLYLSSLIDTRTQCSEQPEPTVGTRLGNTEQSRWLQTVEPTRLKSAVDTGVDIREQRRTPRTGQGDVRVVMRAKPKPKGDHARAPAGGGHC